MATPGFLCSTPSSNTTNKALTSAAYLPFEPLKSLPFYGQVYHLQYGNNHFPPLQRNGGKKNQLVHVKLCLCMSLFRSSGLQAKPTQSQE